MPSLNLLHKDTKLIGTNHKHTFFNNEGQVLLPAPLPLLCGGVCMYAPGNSWNTSCLNFQKSSFRTNESCIVLVKLSIEKGICK